MSHEKKRSETCPNRNSGHSSSVCCPPCRPQIRHTSGRHSSLSISAIHSAKFIFGRARALLIRGATSSSGVMSSSSPLPTRRCGQCFLEWPFLPHLLHLRLSLRDLGQTLTVWSREWHL